MARNPTWIGMAPRGLTEGGDGHDGQLQAYGSDQDNGTASLFLFTFGGLGHDVDSGSASLFAPRDLLALGTDDDGGSAPLTSAILVTGSGTDDDTGTGTLQTAPPFTWPPAGSILAWRADLGVTKDGSNNVSAWVDQVIGYTLVPGTGGQQPSVEPVWGSANLGGQDSIDFSGNTNSGFATAAGATPQLPAAPSPMGMFVIYETDAGTGPADILIDYFDSIFGVRPQLRFGINSGSNNTDEWNTGFSNVTATVVAAQGTPVAIGFTFNSPTGKVYFDSPTAAHTGATFGEGPMKSNSLFIVGNRNGGGQRAFGKIAEILVVDMTTFDLTDWLNNWVASRYGITITP